MITTGDTSSAKDPFDLGRFLEAQAADYARVLAEIRAGQKRSHWMWYIFPQFDGLAFRLDVKTLFDQEHRRSTSIPRSPDPWCEAARMRGSGRWRRGASVAEIFGSPDDLKLRSCATLFASVSPSGSVFHRLLEKYFHGIGDDRTLHLLTQSK